MDTNSEKMNRINTDTSIGIIPRQFKKGGMVNKTGPAIVHKGERVLTTKQAKSYNKSKGGK